MISGCAAFLLCDVRVSAEIPASTEFEAGYKAPLRYTHFGWVRGWVGNQYRNGIESVERRNQSKAKPTRFRKTSKKNGVRNTW